MGLASAFIGIAILLAIGIQILGNAVQDCSGLSGNTAFPGWKQVCEANSQNTESSYSLLGVILIVVAAVAVLAVVKLM